MNATKENARLVCGNIQTGGGKEKLGLLSNADMECLPHSDSTTAVATRQQQNARFATKKDAMPVLVTCNIDNTPMSRKPDKSEYGKMRFRMFQKTLDAQRLCERGILNGFSFTPAALDGTGGDSWKEQRLFAVDIDNHPDETPLTVEQAREIMEQAGIVPLFAYNTFSNTESVPRFRIMIATDKAVTDREQALKITQGFQSLFPVSVDKSAGDLARVFLGTDKGACIPYTGQTNSVSRLLELYHEPQPEFSPARTAKPVSDSDLARAIEEFNMAEYISMSENLQGKSRGGRVFFNPCPICGHKDDFDTHGCFWNCRSANNPSGIPGGNIINYLEARHGWTRERAREYFMYDVLKWDRAEKPAAAKVTKDTKDAEFMPFVPFEKPASEALPSFPVDALPLELNEFAWTMSDYTEKDVTLSGVPALGGAATAIGRKFQANSKPGWNEPMNLYSITIAPSGGRKSETLKWVKRPLGEHQTEWNINHAAEFDAWRDDLDITRNEIAAKKSLIAKGKQKADAVEALRGEIDNLRTRERSLVENPKKPLRLFAQDCTPEKLGHLLQDNDETMSIVSDEGGFFLTLTGKRYSENANLDCLLNAYTMSSVHSARISSDDVDLDAPCLNIVATCQPITVEELTASRVYNRRGLTARFLYAFAKKTKPYNKAEPMLDPPPPWDEAVENYNALIRDLLSIAPDYDERGKITPRIIVFSPEAMKLRRELELEAAQLIDDLDENDPFIYWLERYHAHVVRLAGILHVCKYRNEADAVELSEETFQNALKLGRYFKAHAEFAFSLSGASMSEAEKDARYIWKRIRESGQAQINKRDLTRSCHGRFKDAEAMDAGLNELVTHGYIRIVKGATKGHPAIKIEVNPEALEEN